MQTERRARKWCFVPCCANSSVKTPGKLFVSVPPELKARRRWATAARREDARTLTSRNPWYCCEDHFEPEKDFANYMRQKLMGGKVLKKKGTIPHKFACQQGHIREAALGPSSQRRHQRNTAANAVMEHDEQLHCQSPLNTQASSALAIEESSKALTKTPACDGADLAAMDGGRGGTPHRSPAAEDSAATHSLPGSRASPRLRRSRRHQLKSSPPPQKRRKLKAAPDESWHCGLPSAPPKQPVAVQPGRAVRRFQTPPKPTAAATRTPTSTSRSLNAGSVLVETVKRSLSPRHAARGGRHRGCVKMVSRPGVAGAPTHRRRGGPTKHGSDATVHSIRDELNGSSVAGTEREPLLPHDDGMVTVFPFVQVVHNAESDECGSNVLSFEDKAQGSSQGGVEPVEPAAPPLRARTVLLTRPGGGSAPVVVRLVSCESGGRSAAAAAAPRTLAARLSPPTPLPPPPSLPPAISEPAFSDSASSAASGDALSTVSDEGSLEEFLSEDGQGSSEAGSRYGDVVVVTDADADAEATRREEAQRWRRELSFMRGELAAKDATLRGLRAELERDEGGGRWSPGGPPPERPAASPEPSWEAAPHDPAAALSRLQQHNMQLRARALRASLAERETRQKLLETQLSLRRRQRRLASLLSPAQQAALDGDQPSTWPPEDVLRARQLRNACGEAGYKFLRNDWGMPLPDPETLDQV